MACAHDTLHGRSFSPSRRPRASLAGPRPRSNYATRWPRRRPRRPEPRVVGVGHGVAAHAGRSTSPRQMRADGAGGLRRRLVAGPRAPTATSVVCLRCEARTHRSGGPRRRGNHKTGRANGVLIAFVQPPATSDLRDLDAHPPASGDQSCPRNALRRRVDAKGASEGAQACARRGVAAAIRTARGVALALRSTCVQGKNELRAAF